MQCLGIFTLCTHAQKGYAFSHVRSYIYIYIYMNGRDYIYMNGRDYIYIYHQKNRLFSALPLKNLLSVTAACSFKFRRLQCGLLHPASCTDRVIHAFSNKTWRSPWPRNIFLWALTVHHTLWAVLQWARQWYRRLCAAISDCFIADSAQHAQGMCSVEL